MRANRFASPTLAMIALVTSSAFVLSACSEDGGGDAAKTTTATTTEKATEKTTGKTTKTSETTAKESETETTTNEAADESGSFPVTVDSCGQELTFEKAPENVIMLGVNGAAAMLDLGVEDHIGFRTDDIRPGAFEGKDLEFLNALPQVDAADLDSGGSKVSTEALLDKRPDLVIGYDSGVDREGLNSAGVPFYSAPVFCPNYSTKHANWGLVKGELETYGKMFGKQDKAKKLEAEVDKTLDAVKPVDPGTKAAVLYVTPGSTTFYTYGTSSMVQPILETNGLENAYADNTERVFDASMEDLLERNPEWIILLSDDGTDEAALETFNGFAGASDMDAVKNNKVVVMPFALTDPPSPLSVKGAKVLNEKMTAAKS